jgi:hypothetical protein
MCTPYFKCQVSNKTSAGMEIMLALNSLLSECLVINAFVEFTASRPRLDGVAWPVGGNLMEGATAGRMRRIGFYLADPSARPY